MNIQSVNAASLPVAASKPSAPADGEAGAFAALFAGAEAHVAADKPTGEEKPANGLVAALLGAAVSPDDALSGGQAPVGDLSAPQAAEGAAPVLTPALAPAAQIEAPTQMSGAIVQQGSETAAVADKEEQSTADDGKTSEPPADGLVAALLGIIAAPVQPAPTQAPSSDEAPAQAPAAATAPVEAAPAQAALAQIAAAQIQATAYAPVDLAPAQSAPIVDATADTTVSASAERQAAPIKEAAAPAVVAKATTSAPVLTMAAALQSQADAGLGAGAAAVAKLSGRAIAGGAARPTADAAVVVGAQVSAQLAAGPAQGFGQAQVAVPSPGAPSTDAPQPPAAAPANADAGGKPDAAKDAKAKTKAATDAALPQASFKSAGDAPEAANAMTPAADASAQSATSTDRPQAVPQTSAAPATPSAAQASPAPSAAAGAQVAVAAQVADQIVSHASQRRTRFEVRLDPGELGRVDVRLDIAQDGRVATRLIVERPETLDLLRNDARELSRTLEQAGFQLGQGGLAFQLRDSRQPLWAEQTNAGGSAGAEDDIEELVPAAAAYARSSAAVGGVDRTV